MLPLVVLQCPIFPEGAPFVWFRCCFDDDVTWLTLVSNTRRSAILLLLSLPPVLRETDEEHSVENSAYFRSFALFFHSLNTTLSVCCLFGIVVCCYCFLPGTCSLLRFFELLRLLKQRTVSYYQASDEWMSVLPIGEDMNWDNVRLPFCESRTHFRSKKPL